MPRTVTAAIFKATCLKLMDEVAETGKPVVITKHGKPVAELAPLRRKPRTLYGALKGAVAVKGDIIAPVTADWNALR
jgi:prevent-host-death family protein